MEEYILSHFNEALEKGYIKVYFQPVIRALTGKVCDLEALSRWEDPEQGMIQPDIFIPVLESNNLIHRLDLYVLRTVVKLMHRGLKMHLPVLPISVNLSRRDFELIDVYEVVRSEMVKHEIPRDRIRFEVTETALTKNDNVVRDTVKKLHEDGYQIWLDDFGSGYSSLNVLTRYAIDEMKVDREFLRGFNETDKKMLTSIVQMAKSLGIHTLVEGVETAEQAEFLRNIGCEKFQGFYYSAPVPMEIIDDSIRNKALIPETPKEGMIFEKAGEIDLVTSTPTAIVMDDTKVVTILAANDAYLETLAKADTLTLDQANMNLRNLSPLMERRFREILNRTIETKEPEGLTYVDAGQYFHTMFQKVSGTDGLYIHRQELSRITPEGNVTIDGRELDVAIRQLANLYKEIYHIDTKTNMVEIVQTTSHRFREGQKIEGALRFGLMCADNIVYPEDRDRFIEMVSRIEEKDPTTFDENQAVQEGIFRMKNPEGVYNWREMSLVTFMKNGYAQRLICIRNVSLESDPDRTKLYHTMGASFGLGRYETSEEAVSSNVLWNTFSGITELQMFWKDRDRRFIGANQALLDFYGFKNAEQILGKTDAEMGWHIDDGPVKDDEVDVIENGAMVKNRVVNCIVRGREHRILASKFPVYNGNEIVGLIGYFLDLEHASGLTSVGQSDADIIDEKTGFLNFRGMLMSGIRYADTYRTAGQIYLSAVIDVPEYAKALRVYGQEVANSLFEKVLDAVNHYASVSSTVCRIGDCCFLFFEQDCTMIELRRRVENIGRELQKIREIDGFVVNVKVPHAVVSSEETKSFDQLLGVLLQRLREAEGQDKNRSGSFADRFMIRREMFDEADAEVYVANPETYEIVYANHRLLRENGFTEDFDYRGSKCHEIVMGRKYPCDTCSMKAVKEGCIHQRTYHDREDNEDFIIWNAPVPWQNEDYLLSISVKAREMGANYHASNSIEGQEAVINDAVSLAMEERDADRGVRRLISRIGSFLHAERFLVFEESRGTVSCTYEWIREGLTPAMESMQNISLYDVKPLYDLFEEHNVFQTSDIEHFRRNHPELARHVPGVEGVVIGHLVQSGKSMGYVIVVNPELEEGQDAASLVETISGFIATRLRDREYTRELQRLSTTDPLTGVQNRHALYEFEDNMQDGMAYTFVFGDINGLKMVNDTYGHEAGDVLIRDAAEAMKMIFGEKRVFRLGGDEFMMIAIVGNAADADILVARLREEFAARKVSVSLGYTMRVAPVASIEAIIKETDTIMYDEKNEFYRSHGRDRRRR